LIKELASKEVQDFIRSNENVDPYELTLKSKKLFELSSEIISQQIAARKKAKTKLPDWYSTEGIVYPPLLSMEQCSSKIAAINKTTILSGETLIDLTGGAGVDTFYLSKVFDTVIYVEKNKELCDIACHNFQKLGATNIQVINKLSEDFINGYDKKASAFYVDPARRDSAKNKVFKWEDCTPDIVSLHHKLLQLSNKVLIKASPMLDISSSLSDLTNVSHVHVISVKNECKEVLYELDKNEAGDPVITTKNFVAQDSVQKFDFTYQEESNSNSHFGPVGEYIYEPNTAVLKAGAFKIVADKFNLSKLHKHTHLYTSDILDVDFPGRIFKVNEITNLNKKAILKHVPNQKANITTRNFPLDVAAIRKKTGLKSGGNCYIFAATNAKEEKVILITEKVMA